ncbi:MAG: hypothetical protein DCC69_05385 [Hyphomicrobiales bacterium]|nr:MAG: hypothetical protein DCC69_05385 [Hyphomicrobiales bacterium]
MSGRHARSVPLLQRLLRDRSGQFAMMTAIVTPVALALAAVAVDTGSLYLERRQAQGLADLAAITAAANIDKTEEAVRLVLADNGMPATAIGTVVEGGKTRWRAGPDAAVAPRSAVIARGRYVASPDLAPADRFAPDPSAGGGAVNAVRVTLRTTGTRYFAGLLIPPPQIVAQATAATTVEAAFSVGSRLAKLEDGLANALLRGLTGSGISLSVMDYNALLGADISLLSFLDALAIELDLTAASYSRLLDAEVTLGQVGRAIAAAGGIGDGAKAAAQKLGAQAGGPRAPAFPLSRLVGLDGGTLRASVQQVGAEVGVMELVMMSAILAGKGRQVGLDLGASVPGLLSVSVDLAVGEPPQKSSWFTIGAGGEVVRTAQTRLRLVAEIGNHNALAGLLGARIRIPLYLELAYAEAKLRSVTCPTGRPDSVQVRIDARPGIANLYLAEVDPSKIVDFANPAPRAPAKLIHLAVVGVTGQAQAEIAAIAYKGLTFTADDIARGKVKQVSTGTVAASLTQSLFSSLQLDVKVELGLLGIPLLSLPSNVTGLLGQTIGAAAPALDLVLNELLKALGLSLGQADIRVHGAACGRAVLVQ